MWEVYYATQISSARYHQCRLFAFVFLSAEMWVAASVISFLQSWLWECSSDLSLTAWLGVIRLNLLVYRPAAQGNIFCYRSLYMLTVFFSNWGAVATSVSTLFTLQEFPAPLCICTCSCNPLVNLVFPSRYTCTWKGSLGINIYSWYCLNSGNKVTCLCLLSVVHTSPLLTSSGLAVISV